MSMNVLAKMDFWVKNTAGTFFTLILKTAAQKHVFTVVAIVDCFETAPIPLHTTTIHIVQGDPIVALK